MSRSDPTHKTRETIKASPLTHVSSTLLTKPQRAKESQCKRALREAGVERYARAADSKADCVDGQRRQVGLW